MKAKQMIEEYHALPFFRGNVNDFEIGYYDVKRGIDISVLLCVRYNGNSPFHIARIYTDIEYRNRGFMEETFALAEHILHNLSIRWITWEMNTHNIGLDVRMLETFMRRHHMVNTIIQFGGRYYKGMAYIDKDIDTVTFDYGHFKEEPDDEWLHVKYSTYIDTEKYGPVNVMIGYNDVYYGFDYTGRCLGTSKDFNDAKQFAKSL